MNQYTYDFELQTMMTMFMNAMSDIVIKRFNVHKNSRDQIKVRIVYAPKQRVLNDLLDKDQNLVLPVMSCSFGGIARDPSRTFNKIVGTFNKTKDGNYLNEKQPLPVDITINVSIMTRYQADVDQILSHLLPYINPYFVISWRTPDRPDFEIRSNVYWSGNVNIAYPIDIAATTVARCVADLTFTLKGWMFQALPKDVVGSIYTIDTTYAIDPILDYDKINESYDKYKEDMTQTLENYDFIKLKGVPPQPKIVDPPFAKLNTPTQFITHGAGFKDIKNVYLSGYPLQNLMTVHDPFSASPVLSGSYPPFFGVKLSAAEWKSVESNNFLTFIMPSASNIGNVDLIIEGPVGYGKLTQNVRYNTFMPCSSMNYAPYQVPFLSGIAVGHTVL